MHKDTLTILKLFSVLFLSHGLNKVHCFPQDMSAYLAAAPSTDSVSLFRDNQAYGNDNDPPSSSTAAGSGALGIGSGQDDTWPSATVPSASSAVAADTLSSQQTNVSAALPADAESDLASNGSAPAASMDDTTDSQDDYPVDNDPSLPTINTTSGFFSSGTCGCHHHRHHHHHHHHHHHRNSE